VIEDRIDVTIVRNIYETLNQPVCEIDDSGIILWHNDLVSDLYQTNIIINKNINSFHVNLNISEVIRNIHEPHISYLKVNNNIGIVNVSLKVLKITYNKYVVFENLSIMNAVLC
jgi:transcriptional regulator with PAS, ATPase and Fis domain